MKNVFEKTGLGLFLFFALSFYQLNAQQTAKDEGVDVQDAQFEQMSAYLAQNLNYPAPASVRHIEGTVVVTFTVDAAGQVQNPKVRTGLGNGCDEEAVRLVKTMPKWQPATLNGKPVATGKTLHIQFKMPYSADARN